MPVQINHIILVRVEYSCYRSKLFFFFFVTLQYVLCNLQLTVYVSGLYRYNVRIMNLQPSEKGTLWSNSRGRTQSDLIHPILRFTLSYTIRCPRNDMSTKTIEGEVLCSNHVIQTRICGLLEIKVFSYLQE